MCKLIIQLPIIKTWLMQLNQQPCIQSNIVHTVNNLSSIPWRLDLIYLSFISFPWRYDKTVYPTLANIWVVSIEAVARIWSPSIKRRIWTLANIWALSTEAVARSWSPSTKKRFLLSWQKPEFWKDSKWKRGKTEIVLDLWLKRNVENYRY